MSQYNKASLKDYIHMHGIVAVWGFTSILGRLISIDSLQLTFLRVAISSLALWLILAAWKSGREIEKGWFWPIFLSGILIALHWVAFFWAARLSNVSTCLVGIATTTFWTGIFEPLIRKRPYSKLELLNGIVVFFGLFLIVQGDIDKAVGLGVAIISAILSAVFSVLNGIFIKHGKALAISTWELTGATAFLGLLVGGFYLNDPSDWKLVTGDDWLLLSILALVCTVYPFGASVELLKRFTAFAMNLTINMEPIYGVILAQLIFGNSEEMNASFYAGGLIILASVLSFPMLERKWMSSR